MQVFPKILSVFLLIALGFGNAGLFAGQSESVSFLRIIRGNEQSALPGNTFLQTLRIEAHGSTAGGIFSSGKSKLLAGVKLVAEAVPPSDLVITPEEKVTDIAGCMGFTVKAGKAIGDHYIRVYPHGNRAKAVMVRMVVGSLVSGGEQEGPSGTILDKPLSLQLVKPDGSPAAGVPVFFSFRSAPHGDCSGKILTPQTVTDSQGVASTLVKLGKSTGEYVISVEAAGNENEFRMRPFAIRVLGIDVFRVSMNVLIGITFLILGMVRLSEGLQRVAGENMKKLLAIFSKNGLVAIIAGAFVTAVVQSSTATTVMVLGFINAGLLSLQQAIGIIFGANIGTTITAQLISFNLDAISLPAIVVGFSMTFVKRRLWQGWGLAIFGFGMLFFGMSMMSGELKVLGIFPSFMHFFETINCAPAVSGGMMPILPVLSAIGIGIVAAFLIHSSAAVIGIILALAAGGLVNFYTAVPLLVGTNIGTTITAWIAAFPANRVAKQAAMAHLLFNTIGALIMIVLFYVPYGESRVPVFLYFVNSITPGNAFAAIPQNLERHIAMAHTLFNLLTVAAILPFMKLFTRLCEKLIPEQGSGNKSRTLEPLLLNTPAMAIAQSIEEIRRMTGKAWQMVHISSREYFMNAKVSEEGFAALERAEDEVDAMQSEITNYLVQVTRRQLTGHQAAIIPQLMHSTNDAERIADHAETILRLTKRLSKTKVELSDVAQQDLLKLIEKLSGWTVLVEQQLSSCSLGNPVPFNGDEEEHQLRRMVKKIEQTHIERRNSGKCSMDANVVYIELLWELERVGGHLVNILERTPEIQRYLCSK